MEITSAKENFKKKLLKADPIDQNLNALIDRYFGEAFDLALSAKTHMPAIGFCSTRLRINAFLAVCRHIDTLRNGVSGRDVAHLALLILRVSDKTYAKAATMFEIRAARFSLRDRVEMPLTAQEYLADMGIRW